MITPGTGTNRGASAFERCVFRTAPLCGLGIAAICGVVAGPSWSISLGPLPWLISLVVVGLPHGAADLALSRRAWCGTSLVVAWLVYGLTMACVAVVFMAAPWLTLAVFLALSVWHFGWAHAGDDDPAAPGGIVRVASALAHGGVVLGTPLIAWPAETTDHVTRLLALTHRGHPPFEAGSGAVLTTGLIVGAIGLVSLGVEVLLTCRRDAAGRRLARLALETGVFAALGWCTAPLFSVGLSFLAWHGWRQMADLADAVVGVRPGSWPRLARALARIHVAAIPLLVPTWILIGAAWWMVSERHTATDLAILSIAAYVVVTPAHELLGHLVRPRTGSAPSDPLGRHPVVTAAVVQRPSTSRHAPVGLASWSGLGRRSGRTAS